MLGSIENSKNYLSWNLPKKSESVKKGDKVGEAKYYLNDTEVGSRDIVASESVEEVSYQSALADTFEDWTL